MIVGTLRILPLQARRAEVLEILQTVQGPMLAQPGCTACTIYEEQGPEGAVVLIDIWKSREVLESHLCSEAYRQILGAIELSSGPPEIRFDHVSATEGMELIRQSRNPEVSRTAESDETLDKGRKDNIEKGGKAQLITRVSHRKGRNHD